MISSEFAVRASNREEAWFSIPSFGARSEIASVAAVLARPAFEVITYLLSYFSGFSQLVNGFFRNLSSGVLFALMPFFMQGSAIAGEPELLSEQEFFRDIPTVYSASRLPQSPEDAPGIVTVITREMIRASGARQVAELFRLVPGFVVGFSRGGQAVVAYQGLSGAISQRMQVMLDGRSLYAPYLFGGVDWNNIPISLDDIERVEVLRGSNSASYGANSFLGVANIITRTAAQSQGALGAIARGQGGIDDWQVRAGGAMGPVNWVISGGQLSDYGLLHLYDTSSRRYASLRGDVRINDSDDFHFSLGGNVNRVGLGTAGRVADPERFEDVSSSYGLLRWRRILSPTHEFSFSWSGTVDSGEDRYFIPVTAKTGITVDYGRRAERNQFEYQHLFRIYDDLRAVWGLEYRNESVQAQQLFNSNEIQRTGGSRAYLNLEYRPAERITLNGGGLVEQDSIGGTHVAPRLAINWKLNPFHTLGVGYSTAFRLPSLFEQRSDWRFTYLGQTIDIRYLSRGGLKPERVAATELTYLGSWPAWRLNADARLFQERIADLIVQQRYSLPPGLEFSPDSGAFDLRNGGSALLTGIDYQLRWQPTDQFNLVWGHSIVHREASLAYLAQSVPSHTAHLLGIYRFNQRNSVSLAYYLQGPIRWIGETDRVSSRRQLDLGYEQTFMIKDLRNTFSINGRKILGSPDEFRQGQSNPSLLWVRWALSY